LLTLLLYNLKYKILRRLLIIFGLGLLFIEEAFAGCGSWSLPWYMILIALAWLISFIFAFHAIIFVEKRKWAFLRSLPFLLLTGWIYS
jgi:hypothetical protein